MLSSPPSRLLGPLVGITAVGLFSDDEGLVLCPFRRLSDGYCPLCGATRAFGQLLQGDLAAGWDRHPWAVLLVAQLPVIAWMRRGRVPPGQRVAMDRFDRLVAANLVVATAIWLVRLVGNDIPRPFGL